MSELKELSAEEKTRPYSKYYDMDLSVPDPQLMALIRLDKPLDPSEVLPLENINDLLDPGYLPGETGWCVRPDGTGYVAVNNKMPGVTVDMVNWWMAWHSLEDLRYKIWWPKDHFGISISDADRKKVLDPNTPPTLKFQGVTHHILENVGLGVADIYIRFLTPEEFGFDMSRFKAPNVGTVVAGIGRSRLVGGPPDAPEFVSTMCHFIREIPGGIEYRTRFWRGYEIVDKKPVFALREGEVVPPQNPFGLARHNVEEYSRLRVLLPLIYAEQHGLMS
jgi:hypothetical protein